MNARSAFSLWLNESEQVQSGMDKCDNPTRILTVGVIGPQPMTPRLSRSECLNEVFIFPFPDKRRRNLDCAVANWLVSFAGALFGTPASRKHVAGRLLARPDETTGGTSNTVSSGLLAW